MSQLNINLNKTASDLIHNGAIEYPEGQDSFYMQVVEAVKYKYFILRKVEEKSHDTVTLKLRVLSIKLLANVILVLYGYLRPKILEIC